MNKKLYSTDTISLFFMKEEDPTSGKRDEQLEYSLSLRDKDGKYISNSGMWIHGDVLKAVHKFSDTITTEDTKEIDPKVLQDAIHELLATLIKNGGFSSLQIANLLKTALCHNQETAKASLEALQQTRKQWEEKVIPVVVTDENEPRPTRFQKLDNSRTAMPSTPFFTHHAMNIDCEKDRAQVRSEVLSFIDQMISHIRSYLGLENAPTAAAPTPMAITP